MSRLNPEELKTRIAFTSLRQKLGVDAEKPHKSLPQTELADLLGCSLSTVARTESTGHGDILIRAKVGRIHEFIDSFDPPIPQHERIKFLTTPNANLLDCRPIAFMDNPETFEVAKKVLKS